MVLVALGFVIGTSRGKTEITLPDIKDWEKPFIAIIDEQNDAPPESAIRKLGEIVGKLASESEPELRKSPAFQLAREKLLAIPGHATYFGEEIKRLTDEEFAGKPNDSASDRTWFIHILGQLPSPETVKVLGELLFDERDLDGDAPTDCPWTANSLKAAYALHDLGLRNPPVGSKHGDARLDLPTWQLWYEQVRAGNRTFSFKGDPNTYNLQGVVSKTAAQVSKRNVTAVASIHSHPAGKAPWFTAIGLLVLCGFLGWFAIRTRKS